MSRHGSLGSFMLFFLVEATQASEADGAADNTPPPPLADSSMLALPPLPVIVLILATIAVMVVGTLYIRKPELFAAAAIDDGWVEPAGLGVDLPEDEIAAYQDAADKLSEKVEDPAMRNKAPQLREEAIKLLERRALASLRATRLASDEYMRHMRMYKGDGRKRGGGGGIITEQHWNYVQAQWAPFQPEMRDIIEQANWLRPGRPGWGAAILQDAYDQLFEEWKQCAAEAEAAGEDPPLFKQLRFGRGARVACNMGEQGWAAGTVLRCFELPYLVALDRGNTVTAPQDSDDLIRAIDHPDLPDECRAATSTPEGINRALWASHRFKVGDQVMANLGPSGWKRGRIHQHNVMDGRNQEAAYAIALEFGQRLVFAPHDSDKVVRRCTPEEAAALPTLRFKKGDRVACNMGPAGYIEGVVIGCFAKRNPPPDAPPGSQPVTVPYAIKLDDGRQVFAPSDEEGVIRAAPTAPAAAPAVDAKEEKS